jgi:hypothetical protein
MGQLVCCTAKPRQTHRRQRSHEISPSETGSDDRFVLNDYNAIILEELAALERLHRFTKDPDSFEHSRPLRDLSEDIEEATRRRLELEARHPFLIESNTFTSYSPSKYRIRFPESPRPRSIHTAEVPANSRNTCARMTRIDLVPGRDPAVFTSLVFTEESHNTLALLRRVLASFPELEQPCDLAAQFGRMIVCDCRLESDEKHLVNVMITHLCTVFAHAIVDGIPFVEISIEHVIAAAPTRLTRLNSWISNCRNMDTCSMVAECSRLLRLAFKVDVEMRFAFILLGAERLKDNLSSVLMDLIQAAHNCDCSESVIICGSQMPFELNQIVNDVLGMHARAAGVSLYGEDQNERYFKVIHRCEMSGTNRPDSSYSDIIEHIC